MEHRLWMSGEVRHCIVARLSNHIQYILYVQNRIFVQLCLGEVGRHFSLGLDRGVNSFEEFFESGEEVRSVQRPQFPPFLTSQTFLWSFKTSGNLWKSLFLYGKPPFPFPLLYIYLLLSTLSIYLYLYLYLPHSISI